MRRRVLTFLVVLVSGAGAVPPASAAEGPPPKRTTYTVVSRTGGFVDVAALEWRPVGAKTVLLVVHGSAGVKENNWGPMPVADYSFALWRYAEGRATVAIDLPGYGVSGGTKDAAGMEDYALVVAQVSQQLRSRYTHVVGVGHSMGGGIVDITQGMFASFDAIIPTGWSHGGYSREYLATCGQSRCPDVRKVLFSSFANPRVVREFIKPLEPTGDVLAFNIGLYGGFLTRQFQTQPPFPKFVPPALDDLSFLVTVPVLVILGRGDFFWDASQSANEPSHFPLSDDVTLVLLPNTGHAVFHHLNHKLVQRTVGTWLAKRGL